MLVLENYVWWIGKIINRLAALHSKSTMIQMVRWLVDKPLANWLIPPNLSSHMCELTAHHII